MNNVYVGEEPNRNWVPMTVACAYMDDSIRDQLTWDANGELDAQEFVDEYSRRHYEKYGEVFTV